MKMKKNIQQALVTPWYRSFVLCIQWKNLLDKLEFSHSSQIHQHYARVQAEFAIIRMPGESIIPSHIGILMFRGQCSQMCAIKFLEMCPYI